MSTNMINMIVFCIFGTGAYILMGLLLCGIIENFTYLDLDDYVFAALLFWPIVSLIGAVFQLIHLIEAMFRGDY